jgi:PAS domain S-box-containing protein
LGSINQTLKSLIKPASDPKLLNSRDQWTLEILRLLFWIILPVCLFVLLSVLWGVYSFQETYPLFIDLILLAMGWWGAQHGGWRWVRVIPAGVCFLVGTAGLARFGDSNITILLFAMAVLLAGMLQGLRTSLLFVFLGTFTSGYSVYYSNQLPPDRFVPIVIIVFFSLIGIALLQWFFSLRINGLLTAQAKTNLSLENEIALRKQLEIVRHEQETQLLRLAENTTDMVAELEFNGKFNYLSPSYQTGLGYELDDLLKTNAFEMIHPEDLPFVQEAIKDAISTKKPTRVQYRVKHSLGHFVWIETDGKVVSENGDKPQTLVISSRDITKQKEFDEHLLNFEKQFRNITEGIPLGIHLYDLNDKMELVFSGYNPAAGQILGIDHSVLLGKTIFEAFPGLEDSNIAGYYKAAARDGTHWSGEQVIYSDDKLSGAFEVYAFQTSAGKMAALFSDITEKTKDEEAHRLSEEKFSAAFHTSPDSININRLADGMYIDINDGFTKMTGYTREDSIGKTSIELNIWANPEDRTRLVQGIIMNGMVQNLEAEFRFKNGEVRKGLMSASVITINGEKCLLNITRDISDRILNEQKLREAHTELEQAYEATLKGWAQALDLREHETALHSRNVVELTLIIAREMDMDEDSLIHIQRGALLHDIGKIGVPDTILLKPSSLSDDEWVIMRQHPKLAFDLLNEIEFLKPAIDIPFYHHERWDGSGYPLGLEGEQIPLAARIFAVVDVWDALLSDRPYRPAWDRATVIKYLTEKSGSQFDPEVVNIFLKVATENSD